MLVLKELTAFMLQISEGFERRLRNKKNNCFKLLIKRLITLLVYIVIYLIIKNKTYNFVSLSFSVHQHAQE